MKKNLIPFFFLLFLSGYSLATETCALPKKIKQPELQPIDCQNNAAPDYYALALTWSPQFCSTVNKRSPKYAFQCSQNQFKFAVHGLWPQKAFATDKCQHPRNCGSSLVESETIKKVLCTIPSESLIQGEWQKHGTCSGMTSDAYFQKTNELWNNLKKPDIETLLDAQGSTTVGAIITAFAQANKSLKLSKNAIAIQTSNDVFDEILICYDAAYKFTACKMNKAPNNKIIKVTRAQ